MLSPDQITALSIPVLQLAIKAGHAILDVYESEDFQVERKADFSPLTLADRRAHDIIDEGLVAIAPSVPVLSEEGRDIPWAEREHWDELWLVDPLDGTKEFIKRNGEFTVNIALIQDHEPVFGVVYAPVCGVAYVGITPGSAGAASFPGPGAWRFLLDHGRTEVPGAADLERRAEPIRGAAPEGRTRISMIGSRTHMGGRTRRFMKTIGASFVEVKLVQIGSSLKLCMVAEGSAHLYPRFWPTMEWDTAAGHALVRAAGGELWTAPAGSHRDTEWLADGVPGNRRGIAPMRYNRRNLTNGSFVARGW